MKKGYKIAIATGVILAVLGGTYLWGGNYAKNEVPTAVTDSTVLAAEPDSMAVVADTPSEMASPTNEAVATDPSPDMPKDTAEPSAKSLTASTATVAPETTADPSSEKTMKLNPDTGKDQYLTDPVPEGHPLPVEPQDVTITDVAYTCTLSVCCDTILNNLDLLDKEKWELVPDDGVIYATQTVTFYAGESVFNVLQRAMKQAGIPMEFVNTPIYNSAYIEGINNLYEFDVGELSGWMYKVNGWFPNYGCSRYQLQADDVIEWVYTCDLGYDVGGGYSTGG